MNVKIQSLEIFKTLKILTLHSGKVYLTKKNNVNRRKSVLIIYTRNSAMYGSKMLMTTYLEHSSENIKKTTSFEKFEESFNK